MNEVLTIGHSTLDYENFLALLRKENVTAVADVRSSPYSRHFPHFNRETLKEELRIDKISYVYLGDELGGRPKKPEFYCDGIADYEKMAGDENFKSGIQRIKTGAGKYRIALMCSEHNPLDCHRCLLVGRTLFENGIKITHLLSDGQTFSQEQIEEQLVAQCGHGGADMFAAGRERTSQAYREQSKLVAYRNSQEGQVAAE